MALKFNPFEQDKPGPAPLSAGPRFSKLRVFDDPTRGAIPAPDALSPAPKEIGEQTESKKGDIKEQKGSKEGGNVELEGSKQRATGEQTESSVLHLVANEEQSASKQGAEQGAEQGAIREQYESNATPLSVMMLSGLQRSIVLHIADTCKLSRSDISAPLTPELLAELLATTPGTAKDAIKRLVKKGYIRLVSSKKGRGGWSQYSLPSVVYQDALRADQESDWRSKRGQKGSNKGAIEGAQRGADSGSSSSFCFNKTTTTDPAHSAEDAQIAVLTILVERFELGEVIRLGANDLLDAFQVSGSTLDRFAKSVEHVAFYLRQPEAKSINFPKNWAIQKLRRGFYPEPAGFVSWEEQELIAEAQADKARAARILALKRERFDAGFGAWSLELTPERKRDLFKDEKHVTLESPAPVVRGVLRRAYAVETDQTDLLAMLDAE